MKILYAVVISILITIPHSADAETKLGRITGGQAYTIPAWFKLTFLDFRRDIKEAKKRNRHILIFLHLDACPYCARMLKENFQQGDIRKFMEKNFDAIAINIRGDREVVWIDNANYSEQTLSQKLGIYATPTILFLSPTGKIVFRLDGYRKPRALRYVLDYVHERQYRHQTLASYIEKQGNRGIYTFRKHRYFKQIRNLKNYKKPLAVIFEDRHCADCAEFHARVLNHPAVLKELGKFLVVRLDAYSNKTMTDIDGKPTTPRAWVKKLGLTYRPAVILFNEGGEIMRIDGRLYHFHFKEGLRYVSGQHYMDYPSYRQYSKKRRESLLRQGINIDLSE